MILKIIRKAIGITDGITEEHLNVDEIKEKDLGLRGRILSLHCTTRDEIIDIDLKDIMYISPIIIVKRVDR